MLGILSVTGMVIPRTAMLRQPLACVPAAACLPRCRTPICSMHRTTGLMAKVNIPSHWLPGDHVEVTASNGYCYEIQVPDGSEPGAAVLYAEAVVPLGAEPGDMVMVIVIDPIVTQLEELQWVEHWVEVPEGYETDDVMILPFGVNVEGGAVADIDWDAAWKDFHAPVTESGVKQLPRPSSSILEQAATSRHRERQYIEHLRGHTLRLALSDSAWVALCVLATIFAFGRTPSWS